MGKIHLLRAVGRQEAMQQAIQLYAACTECVCGGLKIRELDDISATKARFAVWAGAWLSVKNVVTQRYEVSERMSCIL